MALWGRDDADANTAPKLGVLDKKVLGNTAFGNVTVGSFRNDQAVGVFGVAPGELANAAADGVSHAGWVKVVQGTGGIVTLTVNASGTGYGNGGIGTLSNGVVNATYSVTTDGSGNVTSISILNPGRGWKATAEVNAASLPANAIYGVTINDGGSDYAIGDVVTFSNGVVNATALVSNVDVDGAITALTFTSGGRGFSNTLNTEYAITTDEGTGANLTPIIASGSGLTLSYSVGGRAGRVSMETLVALSTITGDTDDTLFPDA